MDLTPQALQVGFRNSRFVRHFFFYPSIDSTNEKAKELAIRGAEHGTLVIADSQTAGRGRSGRTWFSPPSLGLYVSVILRPEVPVTQAFGLHMAVALAAAQAADACRPQGRVGIKWPNDLMAEGRKLAGVLTELGVQGGELSWCVVGIGINVNHTLNDFPPEIRPIATSLRELSLRRIDRVELVKRLADGIGVWLERFEQDGMDALVAEWRHRSTVLGKRVRVETPGEVVLGEVTGLAPDGALLVLQENGSQSVIHAGDVELLQFR